ncbi:uncharacterized protein LOC134821450 [Bolinopsis microptera]|uniref:uncharacterized protein LOC134821450 n=1 Tax=Bolinopsis microptera TaxID=2820187 RepID=UPI003079843C
MKSSSGSSSGSHSWTKQDYILVSLAILIKIGDGVEAYLPGVITQKVSCELGLSDFQEGLLAVIVYLFWAIAVMMSVFISKMLGERFTLLLSLYLSIGFAILCAVVPNYYTLLLSRALTGICVGLNSCATGILLAKLVSFKEVLTRSAFLSEALGFAVGGTWVSILGWLILDLVSWRVFVLLTSIPLFVPPIIMLHFCIGKETEEATQGDSELEAENNVAPTESDSLIVTGNLIVYKNSQSVPNFTARVIKSSLFFFCNLCVGYGSIILLPWLMRNYKRGLDDGHEGGKCEEVVQGTDFLILAAVTGATNLIGRPLGYYLWSRVKFLILQFTITAIMALSFGIIVANPGITASVILIGVAKMCYSIQSVENAILLYDYDYFGKLRFELGSSISIASGMFGSMLGTSLAAFLHPFTAVVTTLVIVCVELVVICFMKERF